MLTSVWHIINVQQIFIMIIITINIEEAIFVVDMEK